LFRLDDGLRALQRERKTERGSAAGAVLGPDLSAVRLDDTLANRQA
jgi:hypothetical protein